MFELFESKGWGVPHLHGGAVCAAKTHSVRGLKQISAIILVMVNDGNVDCKCVFNGIDCKTENLRLLLGRTGTPQSWCTAALESAGEKLFYLRPFW